MGSPVRIVLYTSSPDHAKKASDAAFLRVARLDKTFSDYDNASELMRLVQHCGQEPGVAVPVSDDLFEILRKAAEISVVTGGAFDVTTAPVIRQWRRAFRERELPTPKNLGNALARVGYDRVTLIEEGRKVRLTPGTRIDLGGIAKGYAAAEAIEVLKRHDAASAMVAIAGDICVGSPPPGRGGWLIDVAGLSPSSGATVARIELADASVSTSGDAERFVEIDGKRYAHIVDPKTGLGIRRRGSVTVVSLDGSAADAYATSLFVLGVEGDDLLRRLKRPPALAVSWLEIDENGRIVHKTNASFETLIDR